MNSILRTSMDRLAIIGSALCLFHCIALPLILSLFPSSFFGLFEDEFFHKLMLALVIPTSLLALFVGYKKHGDKLVLSGVASGLFMLLFAGFYGHDFLGESGEKIFTVLGACIIAFSHIRNNLLCKACCS